MVKEFRKHGIGKMLLSVVAVGAVCQVWPVGVTEGAPVSPFPMGRAYL